MRHRSKLKLLYLWLITLMTLSAQTAPDRIGVVVHLIHDTENEPLDASVIPGVFDYLNTVYDEINMEFIPITVRYIDDSQYTDMQDDDRVDLYDDYGILTNKAINMFFTPSFHISGVASLPPSRAALLNDPSLGEGRMIVVNNDQAETSAVPHEFGHFFGLFHTFETRIGYELVDKSNCLVAGDLLCDTDAEPYPLLGLNWESDCITYIGRPDDENGDPYEPDPTNFMAASPVECRNHFTAGQKGVINEMLDHSDRAYLKDQNWTKFTNLAVDNNLGGTFSYYSTGSTKQFNSGDYYYFPSEPVDINTGAQRLGDENQFKHHDWNDDFQEYKLTLVDFNAGETDNYSQKAKFVETIPTTLASFSAAGTELIEFHDPWWLDPETGEQPDVFRFIETGTFEVFLEQDPNQGYQYYSLRAEPLVQEASGTYTVFERWDAVEADLADHPEDPTEPTIKAVIFKDDISEVEPSVTPVFFTNITINGGEMFYNSGDFMVAAPKFTADQSAIYRFDSWTTSTPTKVTIASPNSLTSTVDFHDSGADVVAEYVNLFTININELPNNTIVLDEYLTIPAGAVYEIPINRKIKVIDGKTLSIEGTAENPVI